MYYNRVKYVQDIIVSIDTVNLGMESKEVIQVIQEIGHAGFYHRSDNHYD